MKRMFVCLMACLAVMVSCENLDVDGNVVMSDVSLMGFDDEPSTKSLPYK